MADAILPVKVCRKCGTLNFYPSGTCKTCSQAYAKAHRAKIKAYQDEYRVNHRADKAVYRKTNSAKIRAYDNAYRSLNREKVRAARNAWYKANIDTIRAKRREYREKNRDRINSISKSWRKANRDVVNAQRRAKYEANPVHYKNLNSSWQAANPEKYKLKQSTSNKKRYEKHRERLIAQKIEWMRRNPEKVRIATQNRRTRKMQGAGKLSPGLAQKLYRLQNGRCACCGKHLGSKYHLDHIVPLALGGPHEDSNMQLLTPTCNIKKSAKHPVDYMQSRGFLL